jgi:hypothetical protein
MISPDRRAIFPALHLHALCTADDEQFLKQAISQAGITSPPYFQSPLAITPTSPNLKPSLGGD